jgi:hypothetical protein
MFGFEVDSWDFSQIFSKLFSGCGKHGQNICFLEGVFGFLGDIYSKF